MTLILSLSESPESTEEDEENTDDDDDDQNYHRNIRSCPGLFGLEKQISAVNFI